ncbi:MAG: transcription elongation factor GreA [Chloroflexi bacterium]|nr:transcription elongation factor GreA [Chloroflexota bacterium]
MVQDRPEKVVRNKRAGGDHHDLSLGEAASKYLATLPAAEREASQREINNFVRWFGWECQFKKMAPPKVAAYAERLSVQDTDYEKKLGLLRAFLAYARQEAWSQTNLGTHLKTRRGKAKLPPIGKQALPESITLTQQGYDELQAELVKLRNRRLEVIEAIRHAAADKDFRENAPLKAAREEYSHLEGRLKEIEETLKSAAVIQPELKVALKVGIGDSVRLRDLSTNETLTYRVVNPREVDPSHGKISSASPIGKALIGQEPGQVIKVTAPAGKLRYLIEQIGR